MKIWTNNRSNNVHTQRTPLQYRATLHRTTRITLASLLFGRYACLLCFLRPLISRRGLLATSWRRSFGLLLSRCGAAGSGCLTLGPIGAFIFCDRLTIYRMLLHAMVRPTCVVDGLLALQTPNLLDSFNKGDITAELRAFRRFGVQLGRGLRGFGSISLCRGFGFRILGRNCRLNIPTLSSLHRWCVCE